jgi:hypothetical protein
MPSGLIALTSGKPRSAATWIDELGDQAWTQCDGARGGSVAMEANIPDDGARLARTERAAKAPAPRIVAGSTRALRPKWRSSLAPPEDDS